MSKTKPKKEETQSPESIQELFADVNVTMKTGHLTKDSEIVGDGKYAKIRFATNKKYQTPEGEDSTKSFDTPEGYKQTACTIFAYHLVLKKEKSGEAANDNIEPSLEVSKEPEAIPA